MGLRRAKMGSKRPLKSLKVAIICICKNLKNLQFLMVFELPRLTKTAFGGPRGTPRGA